MNYKADLIEILETLDDLIIHLEEGEQIDKTLLLRVLDEVYNKLNKTSVEIEEHVLNLLGQEDSYGYQYLD